MKSNSLLFIVIFVGLVAGSATYLKLRPNTETPNQSQAISDSNNTPNQTKTSENKGAYIDYTDGIIAKTAGKKILFFYAPWCPQCRAVEADINKQGVPAGVTIIKVDYDSNQALRKKYGVTIQTTFVKVDDSGNKTKLYVAYNEPTLDALIRNILEPTEE